MDDNGFFTIPKWINQYLVGDAITISKNDGVRQWEGWHPIYEMENKIHVWNHQPEDDITSAKNSLYKHCFCFQATQYINFGESWSSQIVYTCELYYTNILIQILWTNCIRVSEWGSKLHKSAERIQTDEPENRMMQDV